MTPLFKGIDCIHIRVPNLDEGLAFYRDALGLKLLWQTEKACALSAGAGATEIVLSSADNLMVDIKVNNVEQALPIFTGAGGKVEDGPFDIDIGQCAVVSDPWGNRYCLLDTTNGTYDTDEDGAVIGVFMI